MRSGSRAALGHPDASTRPRSRNGVACRLYGDVPLPFWPNGVSYGVAPTLGITCDVPDRLGYAVARTMAGDLAIARRSPHGLAALVLIVPFSPAGKNPPLVTAARFWKTTFSTCGAVRPSTSPPLSVGTRLAVVASPMS